MFGLEVEDIATKIIEKDSSGNIWFAIKCTVTNHGNSEWTGIHLHAIDSDGFEIMRIPVTGRIEPGKKNTITTQDFMPEKDFKRITKWDEA